MTRLVVNKRKDRYDVYIGRGSKWGNPFVIGADGNRAAVIKKYEEMIRGRPDMINACKKELKGKVLGCFCAPYPCHGDVLVKISLE